MTTKWTKSWNIHSTIIKHFILDTILFVQSTAFDKIIFKCKNQYLYILNIDHYANVTYCTMQFKRLSSMYKQKPYTCMCFRPQRSLRFLVIGRLQNRCGDAFSPFFCQPVKYVIQISSTQSMVAKRGLTIRANVHIPMWKSHLKHSTAEFQFWMQLWTSFHSKTNADARRDRRPDTFLGLKHFLYSPRVWKIWLIQN